MKVITARFNLYAAEVTVYWQVVLSMNGGSLRETKNK